MPRFPVSERCAMLASKLAVRPKKDGDSLSLAFRATIQNTPAPLADANVVCHWASRKSAATAAPEALLRNLPIRLVGGNSGWTWRWQTSTLLHSQDFTVFDPHGYCLNLHLDL